MMLLSLGGKTKLELVGLGKVMAGVFPLSL